MVKKNNRENSLPITEEPWSLIKGHLPFTLTGAQVRALKEILEDLKAPSPMSRLLIGDVGSGKTIVAFLAIWSILKSGYQSTFLVPTEILAEQHHKNAVNFFRVFGWPVLKLTGSVSAKERKVIHELLQSGRPALVIGTHALLEDVWQFPRLALSVIDEQHRFGVKQRFALRQKAPHTHLLFMSATPIPRTLALTLYGDLDVSLIDELPAGRKPIKTRVVSGSARIKVYDFLRQQLEEGRQAYVVYPLIQESETLDLSHAEEGFQKLKKIFPQKNVGLVHGRLSALEKDNIMQRFKQGEIHILVATTVIEVGIDVPNASVMIIENAERFGLAALHQLRGRVGRGPWSSYCVLITGDTVSAEARQRLQVMERTQNGFEIAQSDLEIRGPGELLGEKQSGQWTFRWAQLWRDLDIAQQAQEAAKVLLGNDPALQKLEHRQTLECLKHYLVSKGWSLEGG